MRHASADHEGEEGAGKAGGEWWLRHLSLALHDVLCPSFRHRRITVLLAILLALAGEDEEAFEGEEEDDVV